MKKRINCTYCCPECGLRLGMHIRIHYTPFEGPNGRQLMPEDVIRPKACIRCPPTIQMLLEQYRVANGPLTKLTSLEHQKAVVATLYVPKKRRRKKPLVSWSDVVKIAQKEGP